MPDIFKERVNFKPFEYPRLVDYADAINKSFWIVSEFNFTKDIKDFKTKLTDSERSVIERSMLSISQIEVDVKTFWADLFKRLPKPEIAVVGMTFAESEVRHSRAYAHLLEILGINHKFEELIEVPQIKDRIKYLKKYKDGSRSRDNRTYTKAIMLFSMFIEHVSLFSQFLIMLSFNKEKNLLPGISNVVEATSLEEVAHGLFGAELINIIRRENPSWFDEDMDNMIQSACLKAFEAESGIIDWIYEKGDLSFLPKENVKEFVKNRFNIILKNSGFKKVFKVNKKLIENTDWFEVQLASSKEDDFFYKTSVAYNKNSKSFTEDNLF